MNLLYNTLKTFNRIFSKNNGENNIIKVDKNINIKYSINGSNHLIEIFQGGG